MCVIKCICVYRGRMASTNNPKRSQKEHKHATWVRSKAECHRVSVTREPVHMDEPVCRICFKTVQREVQILSISRQIRN